MTLARRLRFRASLMKVGVDGALGVARDKATSYGYSLTGRKTAPATDFDPFSAQIMHDPYPGYQSLLTGTEVPESGTTASAASGSSPAMTMCEKRCATTRNCRQPRAKADSASTCRR